jgi:ABC-2 type transport system ATP-binding protein
MQRGLNPPLRTETTSIAPAEKTCQIRTLGLHQDQRRHDDGENYDNNTQIGGKSLEIHNVSLSPLVLSCADNAPWQCGLTLVHTQPWDYSNAPLRRPKLHIPALSSVQPGPLPGCPTLINFTPVIELHNVTKRYYALVAVDAVNLTIPRGEVLGVLGPNGAGKTTLFRLIAGFLNPDKGRIEPENGIWPTLGYKPERLLFPNRMRVRSYLHMMANLANLPGRRISEKVSETLGRVHLEGAAQKRIGDCSKGMRQRLALAQALLGSPSLLLLDEPTNGLDPEGQDDICRVIEELHTGGHTVVLSSHQLQEVTRICTELIILKQGQIQFAGNVEQALSLRPHITIRTVGSLDDIRSTLTALHPRIVVAGNEIVLEDEAIGLRRHVLSLLVGTGHDVVRVEQKRATLEEIYAETVQWHNVSSR